MLSIVTLNLIFFIKKMKNKKNIPCEAFCHFLVVRPLPLCILPVCYMAFLPCVNIFRVYLSKKKNSSVMSKVAASILQKHKNQPNDGLYSR